MLATRQFPHEVLDASDVEPSLGTGDRSLEVFGQVAVAIEPSEGTFDHPVTGKHDEAGSVSFDDLDGPAAELGVSFGHFVPGIGTISEEVAQPGEEIVNGLDNDRRAIAVLNSAELTSSRPKRPSYRSRYGLAPLHLFAGVISAQAAALGGLHGLTVDDPGRGTRLRDPRLRGFPPTIRS